jgi:dTDP-4-dehydrorhamnose 3,5-epimerase
VKLVYCISGEALDVVIDLRKNSPTYGEHAKFNLSAEKANMVYIPSGMAHGFLVLSESATLVYNVTSLYAPESDSGIRWDASGIAWPIKQPIVSERDRGFVGLGEFETRF